MYYSNKGGMEIITYMYTALKLSVYAGERSDVANT